MRAWDFPVAINSAVQPRAYEPFGFAQLRAFANVELVRLAIETRKDQIERLDWRITPCEGAVNADPAEVARITAASGASPMASRPSPPGCAWRWRTCWSSTPPPSSAASRAAAV